jgi:hypothetical protein
VFYVFLIIFSILVTAGPVMNRIIKKNASKVEIAKYCLAATIVLALMVAYMLQFPEPAVWLSVTLFIVAIAGRIYLYRQHPEWD